MELSSRFSATEVLRFCALHCWPHQDAFGAWSAARRFKSERVFFAGGCTRQVVRLSSRPAQGSGSEACVSHSARFWTLHL